MKDIHVIIFMGLLEGPDYYTMRFVDYLKKNGIEYYIVNVHDNISYDNPEFYKFAEKDNVIMFTFNNVGLKLKSIEGNFWKERAIPVFDYIVDHPRNYDDSMLKPECCLNVIALDENHKKFIETYYPKVNSVMFSPNGGSAVNSAKKWNERPIDVIYMGNCNQKVTNFPIINDLGDKSKEFYIGTINNLIKEPMLTTEEAIELCLNELGFESDDLLLLKLNTEYAQYIEEYVRRYFKLEGMKALDNEGIKVHVYGDRWEDDDYIFSGNIILHGRIKRSELMDIIGNAKISLCFIPWFKKGCSEKNFDSMLNGALCVTDKSSYLLKNYKDGYNIVYFDLNNPAQMARDVKWLLDNPKVAGEIAQKGFETAKKNDLWDNRYDQVIKYMYEVCDILKAGK